MLIAPDAAAVVGWGRTPSADAGREVGGRVGGGRLLDENVVFPVVAEVVRVADLVLDRGCDLFEGDGGVRAVPEVAVGVPELTVSGFEGVQVVAVPAESGQDRLVEPVEGDVAGYQQPPPDRRVCAAQADLDLVDRRRPDSTTAEGPGAGRGKGQPGALRPRKVSAPGR